MISNGNPCAGSAANYNFNDADEQVAFAEKHGKRLRGHTLVWNNALPPWFPELTDPREAERELVTHIETVVSRYGPRIPPGM